MKATISHRAQISSALSVVFGFAPAEGVECRWSPARPRHLTRGQLRRYRRARDAFMKRLADEAGVKAMVIEV